MSRMLLDLLTRTERNVSTGQREHRAPELIGWVLLLKITVCDSEGIAYLKAKLTLG